MGALLYELITGAWCHSEVGLVMDKTASPSEYMFPSP